MSASEGSRGTKAIVPTTLPVDELELPADNDNENPKTAPSPSVVPRASGNRVISTAVQIRASRGFLTDPKSLAEYEAAVPGAGQKILDSFFEQTGKDQEHRFEMDRKSFEAYRESERGSMAQGNRAQWMGLAIVLLGIGLSAFALHCGYPALCGTIFATTLGSTVVTFIYGRKKQADEVIAGQGSLEPEQDSNELTAQHTDGRDSALPPAGTRPRSETD